MADISRSTACGAEYGVDPVKLRLNGLEAAEAAHFIGHRPEKILALCRILEDCSLDGSIFVCGCHGFAPACCMVLVEAQKAACSASMRTSSAK